MFTETNKYKHHGHFFFQTGDRMEEVSRDVPELPGVYYIIRLARGKIDLVYIGKSGAAGLAGTLAGAMEQVQAGSKKAFRWHQECFDTKFANEPIDALDIYWFVTMDQTCQDLPEEVQGVLKRRYVGLYGREPVWNRDL